ncbi:MAG: hypothetical protein RJA76_511 [Bacteroidota bacterium]|jgi:ComF family protein
MFTFILQLIYPKQCCACQEALLFGEEFICISCLMALPRYDFRQEKSNYMIEKFESELSLEAILAFAWFVEKGSMQSIMHQIKYKGNVPLAQFMGKKFAKSVENELNNLELDGIVPIPLHPKRFKERGYNQSEEIAKGISKIINRPVLNDCLFRTKYSDSLVHLDRRDRFQQLKNSFEVIPQKIDNKRILLLDDTLTTGATCLAAGKLLEESGVSRLSVACLAVVR